jgi:Flp pilus assembly pilin Flp
VLAVIANQLQRFRPLDEDGQDLLEYALLGALIALAAAGAVSEVGATIQTVFWNAIASAPFL